MQIKTVVDRERPNFLLKHFNNAVFDIKVFRIADRIIRFYNGSHWQYCETDDPRAAFMYPNDKREKVILINPFGGGEAESDNILAGMICTSYAMLLEIEKGNDGLRELHYALTQAMQCYICTIQLKGQSGTLHYALTQAMQCYAKETGQTDAYFLMMD